VVVVVRIRSLGRLVLAFTLIAFASGTRAAAQSLNPGPPGPFVVDIRAATSGIPSSEAFVAGQDTTATIPTRGFGGSAGAHVYAIQIGPARLGAGVDVLFARGITADATSTLGSVDPQLSINFGTSDGWSYLSAGIGITQVKADPADVTESVRSMNWGGGVRWFLGPHLGVGFDVRIRHLSAGDVLPKNTSVAVAVGLSLK
jgi:Outer membrane protein beta-barrel domain